MSNDLVERVARAICVANGIDQSRQLTRKNGVKMPVWKTFVPDATAAIAVCFAERDALRAELDAMKAQNHADGNEIGTLTLKVRNIENERDALRAELAAERESHAESNENYMQLLKSASAELAAANGHITDLIDALRQADLWTDEEHDRAPWRLAAKCVIDATLAKGGGGE